MTDYTEDWIDRFTPPPEDNPFAVDDGYSENDALIDYTYGYGCDYFEDDPLEYTHWL